MDKTKEYEIGLFGIEGNYNVIGYHNGEHWNGFACPYFKKEDAIKILKDAYEYGYLKWEYDEKTDTFLTVDNMQDDDEGNLGVKEYCNGMDINFKGETIHVYDIGTGSWTWDLLSCLEINGKYFNIYPFSFEVDDDYIKYQNFEAISLNDKIYHILQIRQNKFDSINHFDIDIDEVDDNGNVYPQWKKLDEVVKDDKEINRIQKLLIDYSDALIEQCKTWSS